MAKFYFTNRKKSPKKIIVRKQTFPLEDHKDRYGIFKLGLDRKFGSVVLYLTEFNHLTVKTKINEYVFSFQGSFKSYMTLFLTDFRPPPSPMWHFVFLFYFQLSFSIWTRYTNTNDVYWKVGHCTTIWLPYILAYKSTRV